MSTNPKRCIIWVAVSSPEQAADDRESIPDQIRRQQERADRNGWLVIDQIVIEGFSRRFYTFAEFAEAAAAAGHTDALRMYDHWTAKDFDILSCRDLSRLGREQSILSEVIARTIDAGAVILPLDEAAVDSTNYRMTGGVSGIMSAQHIDNMKRGRDMGMKGRAARGHKISRVTPMFYLEDSDGILYPDRERYQRLFDDISELFLKGTSFEQIPYELETRGHVSPITGHRFHKQLVRRILLTSRTYGHAEYNRTGRKRGSTTIRAELWVTGRYDAPPDVFFKRDVTEPIWAGQEREDIIDELERRYNGIRGASRPYNTYALSRICVCETCGRFMSVQRTNPHRKTIGYYVVCHNGRLHRNGCDNNRMVRFDLIESYIDGIIRAITQDASYLATDAPERSRIPLIDRDIDRLSLRINNLIELIADAPPTARPDFQAKIDALSSQRDALRAERIRAAASEREAEYTRRQRVSAIEVLGTRSIWDLPGTQANQLLRKLLGVYRLKCNDGDVTGLRVIG